MVVASDWVGDTGFHGQGTVTSFVRLHIFLFIKLNQRQDVHSPVLNEKKNGAKWMP